MKRRRRRRRHERPCNLSHYTQFGKSSTHTHACTHARTKVCTHACTHHTHTTHTHARTHARTHTHTHTHVHTPHTNTSDVLSRSTCSNGQSPAERSSSTALCSLKAQEREQRSIPNSSTPSHAGHVITLTGEVRGVNEVVVEAPLEKHARDFPSLRRRVRSQRSHDLHEG